MKKHIAVVSGDGIGPDIVREALKVLSAVGAKFGHTFTTSEYEAGGIALDHTGIPLPEETLKGCQESDSVLLGAVGGPKWDTLPSHLRPEKALLGLRGGMGLFCNLRPAILYKQLADACPLKKEIVGEGLDLMVVRELTGGIYFGERGRDEKSAYDTMAYTVEEIERIVRKAFEIAQKRSGRLCSVDKANILNTSQLWREVVGRVQGDYPDVQVSHLYVDNAAMQLVRNPRQFDVIVTENMFGDILSDEASQITGSIGMLPSASLREDSFGMYEPIHGSAPDIAGKDLANPIATILSVAMMLRYSFGLAAEAEAIEHAVSKVLDKGYRTADIYTEGMKKIGTSEMGSMIAQSL
ncbi:MAG: 3-isopropylmalate dehydrogenase [Sphaerochaeta sp.]|uniref:3-isopropylmalate dehydrogenase n=1 Tax=Sphaerochaeta sp. TaxID=1972642 RepID=UPI001D704DAB|nr:3-isopropylmalate dehydrogenase [uncultured Sphaerochaeta sp.]MDD3928592.1 3-isopropylmalate dehydrogenase [Sphaerochaeta sp.]NCC12035.1 3-isopropylmalate dehydrogenase [Spirochaetia bacterium]NCC89999.1 3-isopropylmalate dehydrogenase [Spirochaetia bacterium]